MSAHPDSGSLSEVVQKPGLLCFPLTEAIATRQIQEIVDLQSRNVPERRAEMIQFLRKQGGDLLSIYCREEMDLGTLMLSAQPASQRRISILDRDGFLYGFYAMTRALCAQAQENIDTQQGVYPIITEQTYKKVKDRRFYLQHIAGKSQLNRQRFLSEQTKMESEEKGARKFLRTVAEGLELYNEKKTDFYGGAAFAYYLYRAAE